MIVKPAVKRATERREQQVRVNGVAFAIFFILVIISILIAIGLGAANAHWAWVVGELVVLNLIGIYALLAFKIADQWDKAIILRLGRFVGLKGPGPFWIVPIIDTIPAWIDHRVMVTPLSLIHI